MLEHPAKDFNWTIEINGIDSFLVQDVKLPKMTLATVTHGMPGNLPNRNTPGKPTIGDLVIQKMTPATKKEYWAWDWFALAMAGQYSQFAQNGFFKEKAPSGIVRRRFIFIDAWVKDIDTSNFTAEGSNKLIETVTLEVWGFYPDSIQRYKEIFTPVG
jgi:hypothetical protein